MRVSPSILTLALAAALPCAAQSALLPDPAQITQLMQNLADTQAQYLQRTGSQFRFHLHRVDPKEDTLRDIVETSQGNITRLLQHNGQALTQDENDGDRNRLAHYISSGDLRRKIRDEHHNQEYGLDLIRAMPQAMTYTLTPGQPQLPTLDRPQWVLDFAPNPLFHPTSTVQALTIGLAGRLWVDAADHHLVRMEIHITRNLDIALGLLARVYTGGTIEYDQHRITEGVYAYTHIRLHLRLRELMVRTVPYDSDLTATDIQLLQPPLTAQQAIDALLQDDVKTR